MPNNPTTTTDAGLDAWLWRVMQKEKNRDMIAILEDTLHQFVLDATQTSLTFPPRNSFHRRVCYAVARRYGLEHRLEDYNQANHNDSLSNPNSNNDSSLDTPATNQQEAICLVLIKSPHSAPPPSRLSHFADGPSPPVPSQPSMSSPSLQLYASSAPSSSSQFSNDVSSQMSTNFSISSSTPSVSTPALPNCNNSPTSANPPAPTTTPQLPGANAAAPISIEGLQACSVVANPAKLLRRPRAADGKKTVRAPIVNGGSQGLNSGGPTTTLKNFTEEDYQKVRARIFNISDATNGPTASDSDLCSAIDGSANAAADGSESATRAPITGNVAKGPVEGTRGFERRRNRRSNASQSNVNTNAASTNENDISNGSGGASYDSGRSPVETNGRNSRMNQPNVASQNSGRSTCRGAASAQTGSNSQTNGNNRNSAHNNRANVNHNSYMGSMLDSSGISNSSGSTGNAFGGVSANGDDHINVASGLAAIGRRYASESNLGDLQDPDFDRSYIKWARRETATTPPHPGLPALYHHSQHPHAHLHTHAHNRVHVPVTHPQVAHVQAQAQAQVQAQVHAAAQVHTHAHTQAHPHPHAHATHILYPYNPAQTQSMGHHLPSQPHHTHAARIPPPPVSHVHTHSHTPHRQMLGHSHAQLHHSHPHSQMHGHVHLHAPAPPPPPPPPSSSHLHHHNAVAAALRTGGHMAMRSSIALNSTAVSGGMATPVANYHPAPSLVQPRSMFSATTNTTGGASEPRSVANVVSITRPSGNSIPSVSLSSSTMSSTSGSGSRAVSTAGSVTTVPNGVGIRFSNSSNANNTVTATAIGVPNAGHDALGVNGDHGLVGPVSMSVQNIKRNVISSGNSNGSLMPNDHAVKQTAISSDNMPLSADTPLSLPVSSSSEPASKTIVPKPQPQTAKQVSNGETAIDANSWIAGDPPQDAKRKITSAGDMNILSNEFARHKIEPEPDPDPGPVPDPGLSFEVGAGQTQESQLVCISDRRGVGNANGSGNCVVDVEQYSKPNANVGGGESPSNGLEIGNNVDGSMRQETISALVDKVNTKRGTSPEYNASADVLPTRIQAQQQQEVQKQKTQHQHQSRQKQKSSNKKQQRRQDHSKSNNNHINSNDGSSINNGHGKQQQSRQRSATAWSPPPVEVPVAVAVPNPSPAYGLDSTVDFPPLS